MAEAKQTIHDAIDHILTRCPRHTEPTQIRTVYARFEFIEALMATRRSAKKSTNPTLSATAPTAEQTQQWRAQTFAANRDAIILTDADGVILDWNPAAEALYGYTRAEAIGQTTALMHLSEEAEQRTRRILAELAGAGSWVGEIAFVRKDGSVGVAETRASPILDDAGNIIGAFGVSRDITARQQVEADLRAALAREAAARQQLETIIDAVSDGIYVYDAQHQVTRMNAAGRAHLGLTTAQPPIAGTLDERAAHWKIRNAAGQTILPEQWPLTRIFAGEILQAEQAADILVRASDGGELLLNTSGAPIRDEAGEIVGAVTVSRDVTARRHQDQRTQTALDAVLAMAEILVQGPTSDLRQAAHRLADLTRQVLGCTRVSVTAVAAETAIQTPIAIVGMDPDQEQQWWASQPAGKRLGEGADPALIARLLAGEVLDIDMTQPPYADLPNPFNVVTVLIAPLRLSERIVGIITLDYTGQRHVFTPDEIALTEGVARLAALVIERERLIDERAAAEARERALAEINVRLHTFLGIAGHELRTPVASMKAQVQLTHRAVGVALQENLSAVATSKLERALKMLTSADQQANRLNRLIEDVLDLTRIQSGKLDLRRAPTKLGDVVREAVEQQRHAWPDRELTITLTPDADEPLDLDGDRIGQVVTNLLTNALKYSTEDRPVAIMVSRLPAAVRVAVTDQGPGLTPADQDHIWEPFHQADGVRQQSGSGIGLGLGLHICHTIIERHAGRMGVASVVGEGSTFWFDLPANAA